VLWDDCGKLKKANLGHLFDRMVVYCLTAWLRHFSDCSESHSQKDNLSILPPIEMPGYLKGV